MVHAPRVTLRILEMPEVPLERSDEAEEEQVPVTEVAAAESCASGVVYTNKPQNFLPRPSPASLPVRQLRGFQATNLLLVGPVAGAFSRKTSWPGRPLPACQACSLEDSRPPIF